MQDPTQTTSTSQIIHPLTCHPLRTAHGTSTASCGGIIRDTPMRPVSTDAAESSLAATEPFPAGSDHF